MEVQPTSYEIEQVREDEFKLEMMLRDLTRESCQPSPYFKARDGDK